MTNKERSNKISETKITIGLPVVKTNYLHETITSCINQDFKNFELIIQNNAFSPTDKAEIFRITSEFRDPRILYQENEFQIPMVDNWNSILYKASGDFFTLLCDDDYLHPSFLSEIISLSKSNRNIDLFHCRIAIVDNKNKIKKLSAGCPNLEDGLDFIEQRLRGHRVTYLSDFLVRTSTLVEIGGFTSLPDGWGSDMITWFKIANKGGVAYTPKILYYYRDSPENTTNSYKIANKLKAINSQKDIIHSLLKDSKLRELDHGDLRIENLKVLLKHFIAREKKSVVNKFLQRRLKLPKMISIILSSFYQHMIKSNITIKNQ